MTLLARTPSLAAVLTLMTMLSGCAVGPDFQSPAAPKTDTQGGQPLPQQTESAPGPGGHAQRFVPGREVAARWWAAFGSPELNDLVAGALQASPDIQAAEAALRAARETAAAQRGAFWPSADVSLNTTRQKATEPDADPTVYTLHTAQVTVSYAPDVFGGSRRQAEVLAAQTQVQRFQREAVYMTLTANVVNTAIEEASVRAQIAATREIIGLAGRLLDVMRRQQQAGQLGGADVAAQEAALAQVQATLPPLEQRLAEQRNRLTVLAGRLPGDPVAQRFELASLTLPTELPVSLPSSVVRQRPDVRAAEAQWHAASAQIGVATAARLPSLTLTATMGSSAGTLSRLWRSGNGVWSVGGGLLQPVFRGGALLHEQRAAEAAYDQAAAQYRSTVLSAFQNTADVLQAIVSGAETLRAASAAETASRKSLAMARRQQELGATSQAELVLAQQTHQQAALARVQAQAARYANTVALYQALGGGWQAADVAPSPEMKTVDRRAIP
ncbi:efflux transporter outer membrane subunit [Acidovorax sp. NCPPB 2350]|nr:efflux transporter outer membrane subunit [Acidovorax sp. NCPPB 2350]